MASYAHMLTWTCEMKQKTRLLANSWNCKDGFIVLSTCELVYWSRVWNLMTCETMFLKYLVFHQILNVPCFTLSWVDLFQGPDPCWPLCLVPCGWRTPDALRKPLWWRLRGRRKACVYPQGYYQVSWTAKSDLVEKYSFQDMITLNFKLNSPGNWNR